jgi:nicotinamide-nucleotide amidase
MTDTLAQEVGNLLKANKLTLGTVESATGGLISHLITEVSGSSDYYQGSVTSYSNELKMKLVGVKKETLEKYGAVSAQVAEEMAESGRKALGVDICISDTGIAGPTGATPGKPIGLFYIGLAHKEGSFNRKYIFKGDRKQNKVQAATAALSWLREFLQGRDQSPQISPIIQIKEVVTSFIESENKILILRSSARVGTFQDKWGGISGSIEKSGDEQALIEIIQQTGLSDKEIKLIAKGQPLEVLDEKLKIKWIVHPYLFYTRYSYKIKMDREHMESKWITPEELDDYPTVPKLKEALSAVYQRKR